MFILLPIGTDNPIRRRPWANYALIAANVAAYVLTSGWLAQQLHAPALAEIGFACKLWAESPRWYQFFTSMFLHGSLVHLAGNMIFLWVFGNSLNHKLGSLNYLMFYLAAGLFAGAGYVLLRSAPVVGASGAIFGVTGGYLVLFPLSRVTMVYWVFVLIGLVDFSGLVVVGYFIAYNVVYLMLGAETGVAYLAHVSGAVFGIGAAALLLATGAVGRDQFDLLALARRWRMRWGFKLHMRDPNRQATARYGRVARTVASRELDSQPTSSPAGERLAELRVRVGSALRAGDAAAAADAYRALRVADPDAVLPQQQQLDLANQLMSGGQHAAAADAYEAFLRHYPAWPQIDQVELLLGLLLARYLDNPLRARGHLERAMARLADPNQLETCREELDRVNAALGES